MNVVITRTELHSSQCIQMKECRNFNSLKYCHATLSEYVTNLKVSTIKTSFSMMAHHSDIDEVVFTLQSCLNQLVALSDEAEKVITFHKTLLQWELKADNLQTAYSFAKSIVWKTIEHDFYLYVYSQLSTWLRSTYENAKGLNITSQLQNLLRRLKSLMHTCVGLELPSTILRYRTLLNECEGCENGLDSVNFDETTIETQILQLLEQTAMERGYDLRLYDRLHELSGTGSPNQMTSGADTAPSAPPPTSKTCLPDPQHGSTVGFPTFPTTEPPATVPLINVTTSSAPPPTMTRPRVSDRLAGPIGPSLYQPLRGPTVPKSLPTETSKPYSNLHQTDGQSLKTSTPKFKEKTPLSTPKSSVPAAVPPEPHTRPSFRTNVAHFQRLDQGARAPTQVIPPPQTVIETSESSFTQTSQAQPQAHLASPYIDVGKHRYEAAPPPSKEVEEPSTNDLETGVTRSHTPLSPNDTTRFFIEVEESRQKADQSQRPQEVDTDSDDRARADSFDENVSTTFTDLRLDNNEIPESLTDVTGVQRSGSEQGIRATEVQLPNDSEIREPVKVERANLGADETESILLCLFYTYTT
ncbi:hypothetical protein EGR_02202 [Echinococcus granulosus]|uniref:Uncharacterized protein n=1 Tax=Echinococcus granulosus TaxID=6210 RepID=W6UPP5_ECHGR|nr:hypothetical protein EGR_02202 [Echinococcus granulosus]EUB62761.1 hypothetical protein EGR_02202 [Echinococcus granulosus]